MVITLILSLLGLASELYFFIYIFAIGNNNLFTYFWFILGGLLTGAGVLHYIMHLKHLLMPKIVEMVLYSIICTCCLVLAVTEFLIIKNGVQKPEPGADYLIILGARVNGTKISLNLKYRLDAALKYYKDNPDCKIIVSGGKGSGEDITEGEAMEKYLLEKDVNSDKIIKEEKSNNTDENLKYSLGIIGVKTSKVVIASNNFHIYRAKKIAVKQGYENVSGIGTKTVAFTIPNCYIREAFAVIKYKICGQI